MKPLPQEIVKKNIINRLTNNDAVNINNIYVTVVKDEVLLEGHVPTYSGKIEAFRDATEAAKGFVVVNELQVHFQPNKPSVSDREIQENIHRYFQWQKSINPSNVKVNVKQGKVLLSGYVTNLSESIAAEKIVSSTKGVTELDNRIQVRPEMVSNDETITQELHDAFETSALIDIEKIKTEVDRGTVLLSGVVANDPIRKEIEEQAWYVKGVNEVINKITVG
jgi:osmotically-inducible protein OsmY